MAALAIGAGFSYSLLRIANRPVPKPPRLLRTQRQVTNIASLPKAFDDETLRKFS